MTRPNLLVILIDDLRFDEFGAGGGADSSRSA
jgi:arylsulfatase A-like enzyme